MSKNDITSGKQVFIDSNKACAIDLGRDVVWGVSTGGQDVCVVWYGCATVSVCVRVVAVE